MLNFFKKDYSRLTDEELMRYVMDGKAEAFTVLYERYARRMLYFFYQRLYQDEARAQDFLQDLFLKILEKPLLFNIDKKFKTWLYALAGNMCKNEYRKNATRGVNVEESALDNVEAFQTDAILPDAFDKRLFSSSLTSELNKLDENHRMVFLLRYQEDCTISEIAEVMECPEGTVKSRLFYCVRKLAAKLEAFNPQTN